jgi:uncharacterized protein (TIGR02594 family)
MRIDPPAQIEPPWMAYARSFLGSKELPGALTAGFISAMLRKLHAWWKDDETPWCATFVASCLYDAGLAYPKAFYRASSYKEFGRPVPAYRGLSSAVPPYGTLCVMDREGGGHVTFLVGILKEGGSLWAYCLGGNQDNGVRVSRYPLGRIIAFRWPSDYNQPTGRPSADVFFHLMASVSTGRSQS